jgi:diguanylate cyclase (GGDEF)-like protein
MHYALQRRQHLELSVRKLKYPSRWGVAAVRSLHFMAVPGSILIPRASMLDPRWRRLARVRLYCNSSCLAAIVVGCLVLCGWIFHMERLKSALLGSMRIEVNTALGLILLGMSLWLLLPDPPRRASRYWGLFFAALAAFLGAVTVIEYVFGLDLRIDRLLFSQDVSAVATYSPGRMSPITATTFLALGLALLLLDEETRSGWQPSQVLSLWGAFAAFMSLSGYMNGAIATYRIFSFTRVAVYTALVLFMMSVAVLFARPRVGIASDLTGRFSGSAIARRLLPTVIIVPFLAAWIRIRGQRAGLFGTDLGLALNVTTNVVTLSFLVWLNARQLNKTEESLEEVREAKNILYDASVRDELTGLYNRRGFLTFAEEQIKMACSGRRELLVIFADVDGLKAINDGYGHSEGDRALKKAAEVLLTVFRETDLIARLGGDEFAVLALDCSSSGLIRINAHVEKLLRAINDLENPWKLSISVGAVHVDSRHQLSIDELLGNADGMMYDRKRAKLALATK